MYGKDQKLDDVNAVWVKIEKEFNRLVQANRQAKNSDAANAVAIWNKFRTDHHNSSEGVTEKDYKKLLSDYTKFYKANVQPNVNMDYVLEQELMLEVFGHLYEEDDDFESDEPSDGSEGSGSPDDKKEKNAVYIFIVPMPKLDVKIGND